jgi:SAM-dependent methyltransferase
VSHSFPLQSIERLRCTLDAGPLRDVPGAQLDASGSGVVNGTLRCGQCGAAYAIADGILDLMGEIRPHAVSGHEQALRNLKALELDPNENPYDTAHHRMEMEPTLAALAPLAGTTFLELGCGDGRYTLRLAAQCRCVVAVDFAVQSLRVLQRRLGDAGNVAIVLGDVTTLKVADGAFDRVLCTLTSNLPGPECRTALYRLAARAITRTGRFVHSTHHHGIRQRLGREPKSGTYNRGGIHRDNFTVSECKAQMRPHFEHVTARPIQVYLPFARRLRLPLEWQSRWAGRLPIVNRMGDLVLCTGAHRA